MHGSWLAAGAWVAAGMPGAAACQVDAAPRPLHLPLRTQASHTCSRRQLWTPLGERCARDTLVPPPQLCKPNAAIPAVFLMPP